MRTDSLDPLGKSGRAERQIRPNVSLNKHSLSCNKIVKSDERISYPNAWDMPETPGNMPQKEVF